MRSEIHTKYISIAAKLGKNLTSNLLSFGKKQIVNPHKTTLKTIITNISDILRTLVDQEIQYYFNISENDLEISADSHQIEQILINLCTNARDAMEGSGKITITTNAIELTAPIDGNLDKIPSGNYMTLSIADTGKGIPEENLSKICEPFFTTKSSSKGTGLGLSIIHTIVKQHNAYMDVESSKNCGSTFTIYIPALSGSTLVTNDTSVTPLEPEESTNKPQTIAQPEKNVIECPKVVDSPDPSGHIKTILLADDDELIRKSLSISLEKAGYSVLLASDGKNAIRLFLDQKEHIDLVILDVILPYKNGREVYEIIRKNNKSINVLFISGYTDNIIPTEMIEQESLNFLSKPISIDLFMDSVDKLTGPTTQ